MSERGSATLGNWPLFSAYNVPAVEACEEGVKLPWADLPRQLASLLAAAMCSYGGPEAQDGEEERHGDQQSEDPDRSHEKGIAKTVVEVRHV